MAVSKTAFSFWENRMASVFDAVCVLQVLEGDALVEHPLPEPPHQKVQTLQDLGVQTLVCGAISQSLQALLEASGILVVPFVAGDRLEILQAYQSGQLGSSRFAMPGCQARKGFCKGAGHGFNRRRGGGKGAGSTR